MSVLYLPAFPFLRLLIYVQIYYIIACVCVCPEIFENTFIKLIRFATKSAEFSLDNIMYRQIDGVSIGSPQGPVLANIFIGFHEKRLSSPNKPEAYFRYVMICLFNSETEVDWLFTSLNNIQPALRFPIQCKSNFTLTFLDVLICRSPSCYVTSIYCKPIFTGLYTCWDSFCPTKQKKIISRPWEHKWFALNLNLTMRSSLFLWLFATTVFLWVFFKQLLRIIDFNKIKLASVQRDLVYLHLSWLGGINYSNLASDIEVLFFSQCTGSL